MHENWYGPCGHPITNIGREGCALCLAQTPWTVGKIVPPKDPEYYKFVKQGLGKKWKEK
jgi:hypothetical protein